MAQPENRRNRRKRNQRIRVLRYFFRILLVSVLWLSILMTVILLLSGFRHRLFAKPIPAENPKHSAQPVQFETESSVPPASQLLFPAGPAAIELSEDFTSDWALLLVNPWNPLPEDFSVKLTQLRNHQAVDKRAYPDLQDMMDDARALGLDPLICSSYRTQEKQQTLYETKVNAYLTQGCSLEQAREKAGKWVAVPGTSEHQTGLALDIVSNSYQHLNEQQEQTAEQKWLIENSWKYGFVLRYPEDKSELTGINYEPWHYRYVGKEAAKEMYDQELCLEEYLEKLNVE